METDKDKELDNLFKNAMQHNGQHIDFREQDWDSMEQMLNSSRKGGVLWLRVASGIAALLLLFAGLWFIKPSLIDDETKQQAANQRTSRPALQPANKSAQTGRDGLPDQTEQPDIILEKKETGMQFRASAKMATHNSISGPVEQPGFITPNDSVNAFAAQPSSIQEETGDELKKDGAAVQPAVAATVTDADKKEASSAKIKAKQPVLSSSPVFAIRVLASPDLNGVNSFKESKAGSNVGIMFSASKGKWTISTGALYSYKPYATGLQNYRNQIDGINALQQNVLADCRVLDVPLNIDYRFYSKNRNSFSIGTGLSSYFMLREKYTINNTQYNTTDQSYTIKGENQHILGVVNIQATYHRQLNSRFGVMVQPFMKLPLTDIGYGEVRLRSMGIAAGLSWNVNPSAIRKK